MALNPYDERGDSFLYDCDEVPFDEIPPEPGREIKDSGFGDLVIRVQKDSTEKSDYEVSRSPVSPSDSRYVGPLQRTIHQSRDRVVHGPAYPRDHDNHDRQDIDVYETSRKRRYVSSDRGNYERNVRRALPADEGYYETDQVSEYPQREPSTSSSYYSRDDRNDKKAPTLDGPKCHMANPSMNGRRFKIDLRQHKNANNSRPQTTERQRGNSYESEVVNERKYHHTSDEALPQGPNKHASSTSEVGSACKRRPLLSTTQAKPSNPVFKPKSRPLSERLGPPVKKPAPPRQPQPSTSRTVSSTNKPSTNFIKRNMASSSSTINRHTVSRVGAGKVGAASSKQGSTQIKKVTRNNPFSKAKQKAAPKKTNLQKNIALLTTSGNKNNNTKPGILSPTAGPSKGPPNAIADLIHGILSEPDVKEMITTIAQQSVPLPLGDTTKEQDHIISAGPSVSDACDLEADATNILDRANQLLNNNFQGIDATEFKTNRHIPTNKLKHVKESQYCKECRLEFPTTIMRDLHYKTEMHCFVNGDWWKFNPQPPSRISKSRYPISVFCIMCWDIVRAQTDTALTSHMSSKRHKTNKQKFQKIYRRLPLHDWCMWDELSLNFRNKFVPVPSQLRNVMHPEYFYDQRVIKK